MRPLLSWLSARWRSIIVLVWPLALLPLAVSPYKEARCGYVVLVLALFWITEAAPLPVTSLLPVVLFPLLGVLSTDDVCIQYLKETNMMFIGGLIIAISVEHCNLHKRIALRAILIIGTSPGRLLFGLMGTTMFVSMWISNTAATAMVTPIAKAVLAELKAYEKAEKMSAVVEIDDALSEYNQETTGKETKQTDSPMEAEEESPDKEAVGYFLGIAFAASLGGTGTLIGSGTNLTFKGLFASVFPNGENVSFTDWMFFCVPLMILCTLAGWLWLMILYMGLFRRKKSGSGVKTAEQREGVKLIIIKSYEALGPMSFHEGSVLLFFITIVLLWFFREPEFMPGWAAAISDVDIQDSTAVMLVCFLLFVLPADLDFLNFRFNDKPSKPSPPLITWKVVEKKMHWGIILLLGGGFAMAEATKVSGLNELIGNTLSGLKVLPDLAILIIVCIATTFLTQFSSNAAIANIVLPVLAEMAKAMELHPTYLMLPACLCCSYAFILPVGTPPNAFVMGECNMKTSDMIKAGLGMCVICLVFLLVLFPTYGVALYGLDGFPSWAANKNTTKSFHHH